MGTCAIFSFTIFGATGFVGTPSFLMTILKRAQEMGVGKLPFQVAQVGAEALPESLRRQFEEEHGIFVRQGFGTADLGMIAYECPQKSGMHLVEDAIVQVCDPQSGEPLPNGTIGEIVATVNNHTYPMIRFGTGDLTVVDDTPCPCGRTSSRMLGWRGRAASCASRRNRSMTEGSVVSDGCNTFIATSRSSPRSRARYTRPKPPAPISSRSS